MVQIRWTRQSIKDLSDIFEYINIDSKKYAQRQIVRIKARPQILKTNPKASKLVPELSRSDFRELIEGNYRIIYKILNNSRVGVLAVHLSARDLSRRKI